MIKCMNQCLKGYVLFLAAFSCAKGWDERPHVNWQKIPDQKLDESPITITPFQLAMVNLDEEYWRKNYMTPAISCEITTEYEGEGGVEISSNGLLGSQQEAIINRKNPFSFFTAQKNLTNYDGSKQRAIPRIQLYNNACSDVIDENYCKNELQHNRPTITMKCHFD